MHPLLGLLLNTCAYPCCSGGLFLYTSHLPGGLSYKLLIVVDCLSASWVLPPCDVGWKDRKLGKHGLTTLVWHLSGTTVLSCLISIVSSTSEGKSRHCYYLTDGSRAWNDDVVMWKRAWMSCWGTRALLSPGLPTWYTKCWQSPLATANLSLPLRVRLILLLSMHHEV